MCPSNDSNGTRTWPWFLIGEPFAALKVRPACDMALGVTVPGKKPGVATDPEVLQSLF